MTTRRPSSTSRSAPARRGVVALAVTALLAPAVAVAKPAQQQRLSGTAISRLPDDVRRLKLKATTTPTGTSDGRVSFVHRNDPNGVSRFKGTVTCLRIADGVARVTGTVTRGRTASGMVLTGRQYAFTIHPGEPSSFSLPRFAETVEPCSDGRPETVKVDRGGFRLRQDMRR